MSKRETASARLLFSREGTSEAAAESIEGVRYTLRERVLMFIQESGGATDIEIANALGLAENTARPRRYELEKLGLIEDSKLRRKTPAGRAAVVWRAVVENRQGILI